MDLTNSPWHNRPVLVTGCTGCLGVEVTRELVRHRAKVVGLVQNRSRGGEFAGELAAGHVKLVHGRVEDPARLHAIMAVHEVVAVFHFVESEHGLTSVRRAAKLYYSHVPVITARPDPELRIANHGSASSTPLGIARFGQLFGPRDRKLSHPQSQGSPQLASNERQRSTGDSPRDFVYVRDAARACLVLAEAVCRSGRSLDSTFRSGWEFTDVAMRNMLASVLAGGDVSKEPISDLRNPHGWKPETSLADAFRETAEWYRQAVRSNSGQTAISLRRAA